MKLCGNTPSLPLPALRQGRLRGGVNYAKGSLNYNANPAPCKICQCLPGEQSPSAESSWEIGSSDAGSLTQLSGSFMTSFVTRRLRHESRPPRLRPRSGPPHLFSPTWPSNRQGRLGWWEEQCQLGVCSVTAFHWVAKSFTINIVRDIKSMHSEGSSREEKAMLLTQDDP